jgi:hypothetical protein
MRLPVVLFGDGEYRLSSSIFERIVSEESRYDLIVHGCEFKVTGNDPLQAAFVVRHPGSQWTVS